MGCYPVLNRIITNMKLILLAIAKLVFRFRAFNPGVLETPGPVLLVPNHVSWLDWLFLGMLLEDDWKFVVSRSVADRSWFYHRIMVNNRTYQIDPTSPYAVKYMAQHLENNGRLVLFAEGQITTTGSLMKLYDGTGFLLLKTKAKVVTCYLRGANRLKWTHNPGHRQWFPKVSAHFSEAIDSPEPARNLSNSSARTFLTDWLRERMVEQQLQTEIKFGPHSLAEAIINTARKQPKKVVLEDFTLTKISSRRLLVSADLLADRFAARMDGRQERIGVLLPNTNAMPVSLLALWSLGKVPAILNYTAGPTSMRRCAELAALEQVVTSRQFLEKGKIDVLSIEEAGVELIYLEDLRTEITGVRKFGSFLRMTFAPRSLIRTDRRGDDSAAILFTSGSEGPPKGVNLSHTNLLANVHQMLAVTDLSDVDRVFNALPLFHSFGLTAGILLPLVRGMYVFLYPSPLHYRLVPTAIYDRGCTVFLSTNTFLNGYARKANQYDFHTVRYLFAGAEKVQDATRQVWAQRYGVRILEGYGATECAPCISLNTPMATRPGTAGRLMPGMDYRLESAPGIEEGGRLHVRGANVMIGYLNEVPDREFQALDGWYDTGDIASVSDDKFITILGRLKRFAKISGEMVSLTAVEDALVGAFPQYGLRCQTAILSQPDESKGETLVCVTNESGLGIEEVWEAIRNKGLTNLCMPRTIIFTREIPKLGSGKVNYRELEKQLKESGDL